MNKNPPTWISGRGPAWVAGCALALLLAVSYHNSLRGPFVLDDGPAIVHNPSIRQLWPLGGVLFPRLEDGGLTVSGRPLVNLSLAVNYAVGGESVMGYHFFNLAVHGLAGLVLFGVVRRTLVGIFGRSLLAGDAGGSPASRLLPGNAGWVAFFVAAIWLLHPLQTAAVTYIVQRAEAMMGLCYLLALYGFIRAGEVAGVGRGLQTPPALVVGAQLAAPSKGGPRSAPTQNPGGVRALHPAGMFWLGMSVVACLAGMACKEVMVTAPLMILLYDRTFVAGSFREAWRQRLGYYGALASTWVVLAGLVAGTEGRGGTAGFGTAVTSWEYALTQGQAIVHYLRLVVWPHPLVFDYGVATVGGLSEVWWQVMILLVLVAATAVALVRRPAWGFVGAWFFVVLAPSSSVVPVATQTMAEHRMYLALVAPLVLLTVGLSRALGRRAWPVFGALVGLAGAGTWVRNADYATAHGLWADTVAKRPDNARAHHNLGLAEQARGRLDEAARHLRNAVALAPASPEPLYNLALVLSHQDRRDEAIATYGAVLRVAPDHAATHNNLANLLHGAGRSVEAGHHYAEAVRLRPEFAGARNSYASWLIDEGRPAEALGQLQEAIRLQPGVAEMHFNAGNACAALGQFPAAADYYRAAIRLEPGHAEARNNLGNVLLESDRLAEAMAEFTEAVRLQPEYFEPRRTLALLLLLHLNRPIEARPHLEVLARLRPEDREIAQALARARAGGG